MNASKVGLRYAKAVMQQATEDGSIEAIFSAMVGMQKTIEDSKELRVALQSPVISASEKQAVLLELFGDNHATIKSLIEVLVANGRTSSLGDVTGGFVELYNKSKGLQVVIVTTATAITPEVEAKVLAKAKKLTGSDNVTLKNEVDESIIGGFILRAGDLQYNASVANQLSNLRKEFSNSL